MIAYKFRENSQMISILLASFEWNGEYPKKLCGRTYSDNAEEWLTLRRSQAPSNRIHKTKGGKKGKPCYEIQNLKVRNW